MSNTDKDIKNGDSSDILPDPKQDNQVDDAADDPEKAWRMWKLRVFLVILVGLYIYARLNFRPLNPDDVDSSSAYSADQGDQADDAKLSTEFSSGDL
jgi:hypothetical protein